MAQLMKFSLQRSPLFNCMRSNFRVFSTPIDPSKQQQQQQQTTTNQSVLSSEVHKVNEFEKKLLVKHGKYKSVDEVPAYVNPDVVEKVRNKFRIRTANWMMFATFIGCIIMIMSGKKAVEQGESVHKMNQDWHNEYRQKAAEEAKEKATKK